VLIVLIYGLQVLAKAWHHIPFGHTVFAGPQAQVSFVCCSFWQYGRVFGLAICPFASANPTDIAIASSATA
jgi:hypothetical protein